MRLAGLAPSRVLVALPLVGLVLPLHADGLIEPEDSAARRCFDYLVRRSATMREMVSVIESRPDTVVSIRAVPGLDNAPSQLARGVVRVDGGQIHAELEFDVATGKLLGQLEMLAHELAHVVEIACLPATSTKDGVRKALLRRGFAIQQRPSRRIAVETGFAVAVGRQVLLETMRRNAGQGTLHALAAQHELESSCLQVLAVGWTDSHASK